MGVVELAYKIPVPSTPRTARISYGDFKGVDFSLDKAVLPRGYSQDSKNVFLNETGVVQTRWGIQSYYHFSKIPNGLFGITVKDSPRLFVVCDGSLYEMINGGGTSKLIGSGFSTTAQITAFIYGKAVWILDGAVYRQLSFGENGDAILRSVVEFAYIPTTSIGSAPDGSGRVVFEAVNLLSDGRTNSFRGNGTDKVFKLDADRIKNQAIKVVVAGAVLASSEYTVDYNLGRVTFKTAPVAPVILGEDNVQITYYKTVAGNKEKINGATIYGQFGLGGDQRIFLSGTAAYPGCDWCSAYGDPSYFPDVSETKIANGDATILGYLPVGSEQAVITGNSANASATVYLRRASSDTMGETIFLLEAGIAGYDGVAKGCFSVYQGDGYYLTEQGIYSIASGNLNLEKSLVSRSRAINKRLLDIMTRPDHIPLDQFTMISYDQYLFITNGRELFVGDGRFGKGELRWYLWEQVHALRFCILDDRLYFIDYSGKLASFRNGDDCPDRFHNGVYYAGSIFSTILDDDGDASALKRLTKDGLFLRVKTFGFRLRVTLQFDDGTSQLHIIPEDAMNTSNGYDIRNIFLPVRSNAYRTLMILVSAGDLNGGFELYELTKSYRIVAETP